MTSTHETSKKTAPPNVVALAKVLEQHTMVGEDVSLIAAGVILASLEYDGFLLVQVGEPANPPATDYAVPQTPES